MRPELTRGCLAEEFKQYYWLKEELQTLCREHGLSASGSKQEISGRIQHFLKTGEILKPQRKASVSKATVSTSELSLDTIITEDHRCSQEVRAFFKSVIHSFHFSTTIQTYFKTNAGKTYRDVVERWYEEEKRKKDPTYKKEISSQFEYNQYIRDFFSDPSNKGKSREDAIEGWNEIKQSPGSNKYLFKK
ncbi:DUF6434 domain-containing protein [Alkalicoccobacillus gibsonii]|uniref:DUF6434 domain-containing protein n=1 Tax=Alkalicoccobacillus gibsonii TaxID=79881 RepID=UPI0019345B64|nr:DUF6434 domain-containing protein [Alkalicoccobacillus gibsonii]MBM0064169.1 cytoplasmic protein [Alkalicoccobacillus gibsonii]